MFSTINHASIGSKESITLSSTTIIRRTSLIDHLKSSQSPSYPVTPLFPLCNNFNSINNPNHSNNLNRKSIEEEPEFTAIDLSGIKDKDEEEKENNKTDKAIKNYKQEFSSNNHYSHHQHHYSHSQFHNKIHTKESLAQLSMWKQNLPTALLVPNPPGRIFIFGITSLAFISWMVLLIETLSLNHVPRMLMLSLLATAIIQSIVLVATNNRNLYNTPLLMGTLLGILMISTTLTVYILGTDLMFWTGMILVMAELLQWLALTTDSNAIIGKWIQPFRLSMPSLESTLESNKNQQEIQIKVNDHEHDNETKAEIDIEKDSNSNSIVNGEMTRESKTKQNENNRKNQNKEIKQNNRQENDRYDLTMKSINELAVKDNNGLQERNLNNDPAHVTKI